MSIEQRVLRRFQANQGTWVDQMPGGKADGRNPLDFDLDALAEGAEVEREHTDDPHRAIEVAMDHLEEDPEYYRKLKSLGL